VAKKKRKTVVRSALGRGLGALIPEPASPASKPIEARAEDGLLELDVDLIQRNRDQPRHQFDPDELRELACSIKELGVISPIIVKEQGDRYELIAGERRWRAAQLAGLTRLPCIVKQLGRVEALEVALVENLQRADLNPIEEAIAYQMLTEEMQLSQEEVARKVGKDRSTIANALRLLKLPALVRERIASGTLTAGHARAILRLPGAKEQADLAARIADLHLTVRDAERLSRKGAAKAPPAKKATKDPNDQQAEEELSRRLGSRVRIERKRKGGRLVIDFFSEEQLMGLYDRLNNDRT